MHFRNRPKYESELERLAQEHIHALGFAFVTHVEHLPGTPDIVLSRERVIVRVDGCFFHRHTDCPAARVRHGWETFWEVKFKRIKARDQRDRALQRGYGYRLLTIWGCALRSAAIDILRKKIAAFVAGTETQLEIGRLDLLAEFKPEDSSHE
jgi:DNA mismatch endonuclease (patch repair protein)